MIHEKLESFFEDISIANIQNHLEYLCSFEKLSGTPEAERFTEYAVNYLRQEGIPCETLRFPAFLSDPVAADLSVTVKGETKRFTCRPRSFSACCPEGVRGPLFYDPSNDDRGMTEREKEGFRKQMSGRIVVSRGYDERYAKLAEQAGALAWIQVWKSGEKMLHEDTVSPVWGTPDLDSCLQRLTIPVIAVDASSGEELIRMCSTPAADGADSEAAAGSDAAAGNCSSAVEAFLTCVVNEEIREVSLPVAVIPGEYPEFVLLSDHYDTWYIGAFDNTCANAVTLELARVFFRHRWELHRSLRIAWWPGHSNGRYMGSTWYCDHFYDELKECCMASLNSDLIGARGSDTIFVRTTGLEGRKFVLETAEAAVPGAEVVFGRIGRGSDQSFFGCDIPYHLNPRLEAPVQGRTTAAPGGHPFWHTEYDTIDKLDPEVIRKDARLLGALTYRFLTEKEPPTELNEFFGSLGTLLTSLRERSAETEVRSVLNEILQELADVWKLWEDVVTEHSGDTQFADRITKDAGGTICRLLQSSGSPYEQDTAFAYGPLHLFGESCRADRETWPADQFLFSRTTMIRQRNRFMTELRRLRRRLASEYL